METTQPTGLQFMPEKSSDYFIGHIDGGPDLTEKERAHFRYMLERDRRSSWIIRKSRNVAAYATAIIGFVVLMWESVQAVWKFILRGIGSQ